MSKSDERNLTIVEVAYKKGYQQALKEVGKRVEVIWNQEENRATDMINFIETIKKGEMSK